MNALDSPLEALAFNYLSFGIFTVVNNIWTWVAVITAAFSFWRIKSSSSSNSPRGINPDATSVEPAASTSAPASTSDHFAVASKKTSFCGVETLGCTTGKFTVYYSEDGDEEYEYSEREVGEGGGGGVVVGGDKEWGIGWERELRMRMEEKAWYRYQDLTVLDGNVVRLWDGCKRRNNAVTVGGGGYLC